MSDHTVDMDSEDNSIISRFLAHFQQQIRPSLIPWLAALPALLIIGIYRFIPVVYNFYLSFHERSLAGEFTYVGLEHYVTAINDPVFIASIFHTIALLATIPIGICLALGLALLLNERFFGANIFRSVFFVPYITTMVAIAVVWQYMFKTDSGVLNYILLNLGLIDNPIGWLTESTTSLISIMIVMIWKIVGFFMIIILSGLQSIPQEVYEVSKIDGANRWQRFRYVTLPLLKSTLGICVLVGIPTTFRAFDLINTMLPSGGPNHGAEILLTWSYKQAFKFGNFGYGAVTSTTLLVLMIGFVLIGRYFQGRKS